MDKNDDVIKVGDYIIIQRQKFTKLYKFASLETTVALGKVLFYHFHPFIDDFN